ncbi:YceI family protein [Halobacteriovorax sp. GFR7]|uniref:YceI family protein n=2 Tax=Halobacteriovorax TaxID=1652133 RepID=UPI003D976CC3
MKNLLNNYKGCLIGHLFFALIISLNTFGSSYIVNKEHSKLKFSIKYMALTDVEGQFDDYTIYFKKDENKITDLQGEIIVKSINTFDKKRDQHLKKNEFFNADNFPIIKFKSTEAITLKDNKADAKIALTVKDKTKTVPVSFKYLGKRTDPWTNKDGIYFEGSFKINRFDFGINWSKNFDGGLVVGEEVIIKFTIEAYQSNDKPAFSRFYLPTDSVKRNVSLDAKTSGGPLILPNGKITKNTTANVAPDSDYTEISNIVLTLVSTGILFLITIVFGIWGQAKLVNYLEEKGMSENVTLLLSTVIVTSFIVACIYITSEYTGVGTHPLFNR